MRQIQGESVLLLVSGEFELPRVRVIGIQLILIFIPTNFYFSIFDWVHVSSFKTRKVLSQEDVDSLSWREQFQN